MIRLKELRISKNLTQAELAKKLGCNQTAVGKYERGQLEPNLATLKILADFFDVSIDYLIGRTAEHESLSVHSTGLTEKEQYLLKTFMQLNDISQDKLILDAEFYARSTKKTK